MGPRFGEEAGVGAPAGQRAFPAGMGPRFGEEAGVGAPAGERAAPAVMVRWRW